MACSWRGARGLSAVALVLVVYVCAAEVVTTPGSGTAETAEDAAVQAKKLEETAQTEAQKVRKAQDVGGDLQLLFKN